MKSQSDSRPSLAQKLQGGILINFNIVETENGFEYDQVKVSETPTKSEIVEAVMASKYTTGAEFAAINNKDSEPEEYQEYQDFRVFAKAIADEVLTLI